MTIGQPPDWRVGVQKNWQRTQDAPSIQAVARATADAGLAALTFDCRHFGGSGGTPRQLVRIEGQEENFHAAIRCARGHLDIDPDGLLWRNSLDGGHAIAVAEFAKHLSIEIKKLICD